MTDWSTKMKSANSKVCHSSTAPWFHCPRCTNGVSNSSPSRFNVRFRTLASGGCWWSNALTEGRWVQYFVRPTVVLVSGRHRRAGQELLPVCAARRSLPDGALLRCALSMAADGHRATRPAVQDNIVGHGRAWQDTPLQAVGNPISPVASAGQAQHRRRCRRGHARHDTPLGRGRRLDRCRFEACRSCIKTGHYSVEWDSNRSSHSMRWRCGVVMA